jgi:hypothetical protein
MVMQDKEFDELFSSKLGELEVEPSDGLWDNIAAEVVIDKKDRSALPFISIAASVLVLITAGVFFIPKLKQDNLKPAVAVVGKHTDSPKISIAPAQTEHAAIEPQPAQIAAVTASPKTRSIKRGIRKQNNSLPAVKMEDVNPQQQIALVTLKAAAQNNVDLTSVKPDINTAVVTAQANIAPAVTDEVKVIPINSLADQQMPAKTVAAVQPKKRRIRSFGDLINVVVSKVDKRKDKLIEFSSKDDDESLITGVNLGIIKVKKEEVIATNK